MPRSSRRGGHSIISRLPRSKVVVLLADLGTHLISTAAARSQNQKPEPKRAKRALLGQTCVLLCLQNPIYTTRANLADELPVTAKADSYSTFMQPCIDSYYSGRDMTAISMRQASCRLLSPPQQVGYAVLHGFSASVNAPQQR